MKIDAHQLAVALAPGALLALLGLGLGAIFAATLAPDERAVLGEMIAPRVPLLVLGWAVLAIALGALARRAHAIWVTEPARLAEAAQATAAGGAPHRSAPPRRRHAERVPGRWPASSMSSRASATACAPTSTPGCRRPRAASSRSAAAWLR